MRKPCSAFRRVQTSQRTSGQISEAHGAREWLQILCVKSAPRSAMMTLFWTEQGAAIPGHLRSWIMRSMISGAGNELMIPDAYWLGLHLPIAVNTTVSRRLSKPIPAAAAAAEKLLPKGAI